MDKATIVTTWKSRISANGMVRGTRPRMFWLHCISYIGQLCYRSRRRREHINGNNSTNSGIQTTHLLILASTSKELFWEFLFEKMIAAWFLRLLYITNYFSGKVNSAFRVKQTGTMLIAFENWLIGQESKDLPSRKRSCPCTPPHKTIRSMHGSDNNMFAHDDFPESAHMVKPSDK